MRMAGKLTCPGLKHAYVEMRYTVEIGEREEEIELTRKGGKIWIRLSGKQKQAQLLTQPDRKLCCLLLADEIIPLSIEGKGGCYKVQLKGWEHEVKVERSLVRKLKRYLSQDDRGREKTGESVVAAMSGLVVKVRVREGQEIREGDSLVVIDAMKMECEIRASCSGIVERVAVKEGEEIERGWLLCYISQKGER